MKYTYLQFQEIGRSATGKTKIVRVNAGANVLGELRWYSQWRRYCFYPCRGVVFDAGCLGELAGKLKEMMTEHKAASV